MTLNKWNRNVSSQEKANMVNGRGGRGMWYSFHFPLGWEVESEKDSELEQWPLQSWMHFAAVPCYKMAINKPCKGLIFLSFDLFDIWILYPNEHCQRFNNYYCCRCHIFLSYCGFCSNRILPYFPLLVCSSVTGVTSHISHIYKGINATLIIRGPIKPYIF